MLRAAAGETDHVGSHRLQIGRGTISLCSLGQQVCAGFIGVSGRGRALLSMDMGRHLVQAERMEFLATDGADLVSLLASHVHRRAALQIGKGKGLGAIAAIGSADQREQRLVLVDRHSLTVAKRPAFRGKSKGNDSDFGNKRRAHSSPPYDEFNVKFS